MDLHRKSFVSQGIQCFWSHSWRGNCFNKLLTLFVLYNGVPAICSGCFMAILAAILFVLLPEMPGPTRQELRSSPWCLCMGFSSTILLFLLWRPHQPVFFDRICINQKDKKLKMEAILSLSGMLKRSKEMLVLWDSTWTSRLWCLFELAAFMKSKDSNCNTQILTVQPTFIGPCFIAIFVMSFLGMLPITFWIYFFDAQWLMSLAGALFAMCLPPALVASKAFRSYFNSVDLLEHQLRTASLDEAHCSCCDCHHVSARGYQLMCDRMVVKGCVKMWFGSQEAFEKCLHSELLETLSWKLRYGVFTKKYCLAMTMPILWGFMDVFVSWAVNAWWALAVETLFFGLFVWSIWMPLTFEWFVYFARRFGPKGSTCFRDLLRSILVVLLAMPMVIIVTAIYVGHTFLAFNFYSMENRCWVKVWNMLCRCFIWWLYIYIGKVTIDRQRRPTNAWKPTILV